MSALPVYSVLHTSHAALRTIPMCTTLMWLSRQYYKKFAAGLTSVRFGGAMKLHMDLQGAFVGETFAYSPKVL